MAKKVVFAWLTKVIDFDTEAERARYLASIKGYHRVASLFEYDGKYSAEIQFEVKGYNAGW